MVDFRARRYMDCANLLAGLIDAQSIKQILLDIKNGKCQLNKKGNYDVSQGWRAFYLVFKTNFSQYFGNLTFNGNGNKLDREKGYSDFINDAKSDLHDYKVTIPLVHLGYCLLRFFDDSNWQNYPNNKPEAINRHWLMHGMYDIEDVEKADCVKLLLMLDQMTMLYSTLR